MADDLIDTAVFVPRTEDWPPPIQAPTLVLRFTKAETWKLLYLMTFATTGGAHDLEEFRSTLLRTSTAALIEQEVADRKAIL